VSATVTLRAYTGSGAATESAALTGIALMSTDSAANTPNAAQVADGTNSFEKWLRLRLDNPGGETVSGFWIIRTGDLPEGVVIKMGVTDTPATPTTAPSTVASTTLVEGRRYIFDDGSYDTAADHTRYVVLQEQVASGVAPGAIDQQVFEVGWSAS
jgi:hypothetical protein